VEISHNGKVGVIIPGYLLTEKISESSPHVVYLATREKDGEEVVIKTLIAKYPKKEDLAGIQREYQITSELQSEGIIRLQELVPFGHGNLGIVMEKFGISLSQYLANCKNQLLPVNQFLPVAIHLVEILGRVHEKKIIHKDLVPTNILIEPATQDLRLIDFSGSSELLREFQDTTLSKRIEGSLPYISPEQTGRMNRDVDYRTDYYSLGVSFYQMLTGQLPFLANDALEWVHCHISRQPRAPHEINKEIPKVISDIITKLISKNAEDRYQTSKGLVIDLEKCRDEINKGSINFSFDIAQSDKSRQFQIPQKLYGRENELQKLKSYFENARHGSVEFCLVSGYSGVGKSVLILELGRSIVQKGGYLINGKFEQFRQNAAYVALAHAFRDLIRQLLGEPKSSLDIWKDKIIKVLGSNAQIITDLIPELEIIIGKQPPVQELPPAEAQNRFSILFLNFVKIFSSEKNPLVIFMDDLQWSDVPTLNLIQRLVTTHELSYLLLIGAYRENAVDETHPLSLTLSEIQNKRYVENLSLLPLSLEAVNQITADTLMCDNLRSKELSQILFEKTGGNPFFTIELLKNLNDREVIFFNPAIGSWDWEIDSVKRVEHSDNVVDFLVASQSRLDKATQHVLQLAACIGATFDLKTLSIIRESTMDKTAAELYDALKANMVIPLNESYKFVGLGPYDKVETSTEVPQASYEHLNPTYKFQHDRVQQAAYSMIEPEKRKALHLSIGRLILSHSKHEELDAILMDVVGHFNEGRTLIKVQKERNELANLNLKAGIKAKQSSAYESALDFLLKGHEMLDRDAWKNEYELIWKLSEEIQHCLYLTGDREGADSWTEIMLAHAHTPIEKGLVLSARTRQYATIGKMRESIQAAYEGLSILGFQFVQVPDSKNVTEEVSLITDNLKGREISDLINMPKLTDTKAKIASQLLMEIFPAAFLSGSGEMFPYLVLKSVNIALCYGNSPETAFAYAAYGMLLCGFFNEPAKGYEYGKLGVNIIETFGDIALKSRIIYVYTMFVHHWSNHWSSMTPWFRKGIDAGYQSGDLLYLAYSAQDCIIWDPQLDLETATKEHRKLLAIVRECEYQDSLDSGTLFLQMLLNFQGLTKDKYSLSDENFDEATCVQTMLNRHFMTGIANYHIYKSEIHFLYNDSGSALIHVLEQEKLIASVMSLPQLVRFHIVSFLVRSMLIPDLKQDEKDLMLSKMDESFTRVTAWAKHCPENFEHLRLLMEAELSGISGMVQEALSLYEQSVSVAKKNAYIRDEAIANEMAARYLIRIQLPKAAEGYLQAAHYLYYRWGAHRKIAEMEKSYQLFIGTTVDKNYQAQGSNRNESGSGDSVSYSSDMLDMSSVFRASQTISGELVLEKLLKATLQILIENAGAQKGYIVELKEGQVFIQAQNQADNIEQNQVQLNQDTSVASVLPISLINTALRTSESIVIDNASKINPFSSDPYINKQKPLSVMCVPLPIHGQWKAAVYLENNLTHSAFTEERVKVIKLLAGQAAISIENARIYEEQEKLLKAQQRFVPIQFLRHLGHSDIAKVELGESVAMEMSVLFSDIRDFTPLVELLSPQAVIELLNEYYSLLGIPISASGGFIDSYAGDEIMALFAVPAQQAVEAGVKMSEALYAFNQNSISTARPILNMGIGMNTGPLVLGTMGGIERMQCSVLGDTVNLASRIEQLTKVYGSHFLIGERTYLSLKNPTAFSIRMVDYVAVKGKEAAVKLYEVLDAEKPERRAAKEATIVQLNAALDAYFLRNFSLSYKILSEAMNFDPLDPVLSLFASRSKRYMEIAPPDDWQGYEKLNVK
jgi:predicted ATPase/serine/threonine protein kinase/class 3 adenylate cyclase